MKEHITMLQEVNPADITALLFKLAEKFTVQIESIKSHFPKWDEFSDTRVYALVSLREVTNNAILSSIFIKDYLCKDEWWKTNSNFKSSDATDDYIKDRLYSYGVDFSSNYIFLIFNHLEVSLRSIFKSVTDPSKPGENEKFWRIRNYLIDYCSLNQSYKDLLKIFQHVRNSQHNGGFHSGDTEKITYNGSEYIFEKNKPISISPWDFCRDLIPGIVKFFNDLVNSEKIKNIEKIVHPFATIEFKEEPK
jgi:hypothetical protein